MKAYSREILGSIVIFFRVRSYAGWYGEIREKEYGDYVTSEMGDRGSEEEKEVFEMLEVQAEETLARLLKNESKEPQII